MSSTPPPSYDELNVQGSSNENQTQDEKKMVDNQDSTEDKVDEKEICSMCFEKFKNKSYPVTCGHPFCFECLKSWALKYLKSVLGPICPVCNRSFEAIQHSLRNNNKEFELYNLPFDPDYKYSFYGGRK